MTLTILLLTLNPFYVSLPRQLNISFWSSRADFVLNVLMFVPVGFLFRLAGGKLRNALLSGAVISFGVEAMQIFLPARVPSVMDIVANTLGAGSGAAARDLLAARIAISATTVKRLRLEAPLMGSVYLMIPLLWANELASRNAADRWVLTALLGISGAIVLGEVCRRWSTAPRRAVHAALAAAVWFLLGSAPGLLYTSRPWWIAAGIAFLAAALALEPRDSGERRFERVTLQRVLPVFALYLMLMAWWHPLQPLSQWHAMFGFTVHPEDASVKGIYPRLEYLIAFTVAGYLHAEWRGRSQLSLAWDLPRLFAASAIAAISLEMVAGFQADSGASFVRGVLATIGACMGGAIYHQLRSHARFLLGHSG